MRGVSDVILTRGTESQTQREWDERRILGRQLPFLFAPAFGDELKRLRPIARVPLDQLNRDEHIGVARDVHFVDLDAVRRCNSVVPGQESWLETQGFIDYIIQEGDISNLLVRPIVSTSGQSSIDEPLKGSVRFRVLREIVQSRSKCGGGSLANWRSTSRDMVTW